MHHQLFRFDCSSVCRLASKMNSALPLLCLIVLSACSASHSTIERTIQRDREASWEALVRAFSRKNLPLVKASKTEGQIETAWTQIQDLPCDFGAVPVSCRAKYKGTIGKGEDEDEGTEVSVSYIEECKVLGRWEQVECENRAYNLLDAIIFDAAGLAEGDFGPA